MPRASILARTIAALAAAGVLLAGLPLAQAASSNSRSSSSAGKSTVALSKTKTKPVGSPAGTVCRDNRLYDTASGEYLTTGTWQGCVGQGVSSKAYCSAGALVYRFYGNRDKFYTVRGYTVSTISWPWCKEVTATGPVTFDASAPSALDAVPGRRAVSVGADVAQILPPYPGDPRKLPIAVSPRGNYTTSYVERTVGESCVQLQNTSNAVADYLAGLTEQERLAFGRNRLELSRMVDGDLPLLTKLAKYNMKYSLAGQITDLTAEVFADPASYQPASGDGAVPCDSVYDFARGSLPASSQPVVIGACYVPLDVRAYVGDRTVSFRTQAGSDAPYGNGGYDGVRHVSPKFASTPVPRGARMLPALQERSYRQTIREDLLTYATDDLWQPLKRTGGTPDAPSATLDDILNGKQDSTRFLPAIANKASAWARCVQWPVNGAPTVVTPPTDAPQPPTVTDPDLLSCDPNVPGSCIIKVTDTCDPSTEDCGNGYTCTAAGTCTFEYRCDAAAGPCDPNNPYVGSRGNATVTEADATVDITVTLPDAFTASGWFRPQTVTAEVSNLRCTACGGSAPTWVSLPWRLDVTPRSPSVQMTGSKRASDNGTIIDQIEWTGAFFNGTQGSDPIAVDVLANNGVVSYVPSTASDCVTNTDTGVQTCSGIEDGSLPLAYATVTPVIRFQDENGRTVHWGASVNRPVVTALPVSPRFLSAR